MPARRAPDDVLGTPGAGERSCGWSALEAVWEKFGGQVRLLDLEIGGGEWGRAGMPMPMGNVGKIVRVCPALEELNLRVGAEEDLTPCWME